MSKDEIGFYAGCHRPTATLLLYPGLGPAMQAQAEFKHINNKREKEGKYKGETRSASIILPGERIEV